jgi:mannose-6-phosphate isomerase class I
VLDCLKRWRDDKALDLSPAYRLNTGEGFYTRAGVPHAPGTALTLELGEASDEYHILQAEYMGKLFSKRNFLIKDLPNEEAVVKLINFEASTGPHYYQKYHLLPEPVSRKPEGDCSERWIYSPRTTRKYSGKELRVKPGTTVTCHEEGAHPVLIWQGRGVIVQTQVRAQLGQDEVFVTKETAEVGYTVKNTGSSWLVAYKAFGPNVYSQT